MVLRLTLLVLGVLVPLTAAGDTVVLLAWDYAHDPAHPIEGFLVYGRLGQGAWELREVIPKTQQLYNADIRWNGEHCFQVTAYDAETESAPSNTVCVVQTEGLP